MLKSPAAVFSHRPSQTKIGFLRELLKKSQKPWQKCVKVVSIIKDKLFSEEIPCHSIFGVREKKNGYLLSDRLEFHFLELGKVNPNRKIEEMSPIERLAVYLRYASDENYKESVQKIAGSEEEIIMAENL